MTRIRLAWCCGAGLLTAAVGSFLLVRHGGRDRGTDVPPDDRAGVAFITDMDFAARGDSASLSGGGGRPGDWQVPEAAIGPEDLEEVRFFPFPATPPQLGMSRRGIVAAEAQEPPGRLSTPEHATPIDVDPDADVLDVLRRELPHATAEEHDVWREELEGLPAEAVRDILRLRRRLGSIPPAQAPPVARRETPRDTPPSTRDGALPAPGVLDDAPLDGGGAISDRWHQTIRALRQARDVARHNVANAGTPGFKRRRVVFAELSAERAATIERNGPADPAAAGSGWSEPGLWIGAGAQVLWTPSDQSQGALQTTGRELDLGIDGPGFFQIRDADETLYTRAGSFRLSASGDVVLAGPGRERRLEPALRVPPDAIALEVSARGAVSVHRSGIEEPAEIGRISLTRFVDPGSLEPRGGNLFAAGPGAGSPRSGPPGEAGLGTVRQYTLEASNVDLADEFEELERLERQLGALREAQDRAP